ncbi:hypothetical protein [Streptomyces sp. NPDC060035]|uniref:hypothetical protein n=1 Tax=Streptomyces sp. NPDC060035 TaxID=3347044 RepID=UPI0036BA5DC9
MHGAAVVGEEALRSFAADEEVIRTSAVSCRNGIGPTPADTAPGPPMATLTTPVQG